MAQTTVGGILNNVKIETNLYGVTEIDPWLIDTFNEIFQEYTALDIYPQYLVKDWQLNLTAATEAVSLPSGTGQATSTLNGSSTTNVSNGDTVTIGVKTYTFVTAVPASEGEVKITGAGNSDSSLTNLIAAINHDTTNTNFFCAAANTQVTAGALVGNGFTVTAIVVGTTGNSIAVAETSTVLSWSSALLQGGLQPLQHLLDQNIRYFPVNGQGIPLFLRKYDKYRQVQDGPPVQFIRIQNTLLLTPFANIQTGDYLLIDYYSLPNTLTINDPFPYPPIIPTIKKELMARAVILTDSPAFARFKVMAKESYSKSKSILQ